MLTEEQLEYISNALVPLFQYLEHEVIVDIAARIQKAFSYTRTAEIKAQALYELGYSPARIRKEAMKILKADPEFRKQVAKNTLEYQKQVKQSLREISKQAVKAGDEIFADVGDLSYLDDLRTWKQQGKILTDDSFLPKLVSAIDKQTAGELANLTRTTGFKGIYGFESIENAYKRELDRAMIKITSGAYSKEEIIHDVIHNMSQSGLRSIDYKSGRSKQLDTGVKLAMRTGAHQLAHKIKDNNFLQSGENLVYVSKHIGARNTGHGHANHEAWQGQVYYVKPGHDYSKEADRIGQIEIKDLWEATGYSIDDAHENDPLGFLGYNCRHTYYVWHEGSSQLNDFKEEKELAAVEINGKMYDYYALTQKQRAMERNIRALKREREALTKLNQDTTQVKKQIKAKIREYEDFCKKYKVPEKYNNIQYDAGSSDLKKTQAWKDYKNLIEKSQNSVTLDTKESIIETDKENNKGKIQMIENIEQRNNGKGNASAIIHFGTGLNNRQKDMLTKLPDYDSRYIASKKDIRMSDLSALTAETGVEFAMFTKGQERLIIRGNETSVNVTNVLAKELKLQGYRWSGHTHPGTTKLCLMPSDGDKNILDQFEQPRTAIYNSIGKWYILEKEEK